MKPTPEQREALILAKHEAYEGWAKIEAINSRTGVDISEQDVRVALDLLARAADGLDKIMRIAAALEADTEGTDQD